MVTTLQLRKWVPLLGMLALPVAVWFFYKPIRVVAPVLTGLSCISATLCLDDVRRRQQATTLYAEALHYVDTTIGLIAKPPRVLFCSTENCAQTFGLGKRSAFTLATLGIVISPRAWQPYYVRHELIHYLQFEKLGLLQAWRSPNWYSEGMAYALSADPRVPLPAPFEQYRSQFSQWYRQVGKAGLWQARRQP